MKRSKGTGLKCLPVGRVDLREMESFSVILTLARSTFLPRPQFRTYLSSRIRLL